MKKGDIVKISYTGRVKETGELFDTTDETLAKKENAHNPNAIYGPVAIVVGEGRTLKGLDEKLLEMNVGDEDTFEIQPEKAFGKRSPSLIKLIPQAEFKKSGIDPQPGRIINFGKMNGRILSSNSGRIRIDFNHPLAGRELVYTLKVKSEVTDPKERADGLIEFYLGKRGNVSLKDKKVSIETDVEIPDHLKQMITDDIKKYMSGYEPEFNVADKKDEASGTDKK